MIDTHAAVQDLEAGGADPKPAEAIVRTVRPPDDDLVTRAALRAGLAQLEQRLTLWIVGIVAVANGLLNRRSAFQTLPPGDGAISGTRTGPTCLPRASASSGS